MIDPTVNRHEFVGGSDVAAIMGLSRWSTPLKTWALKTQSIPDDFVMNEAMELGVELEDFVAKKFSKATGKKVQVDNRDFTHPEYPYMKAHIDRWIVGGEILECKTCSGWKAKEWDGDEIPDEYFLQLNWYLGIVGKKVGHIAVLIGGQMFRHKLLNFSQALFDTQVAAVKEFWEDFVLLKQAPMALSADHDTLIELHPESRNEEMIQVDDCEIELHVNQLSVDRMEGKAQIKDINVDVSQAENSLKQMIGDNVGIETGQHKITWKYQERNSVDTKKMKEDGIYDRYTKTTSTRVLRVVEKSSKKED